MSVKREVSEKNRKFNSNWEQTTVSCEVTSEFRSERDFLKRCYSTKHEKIQKNHGNSREALLQ